MQKQKHFDTTEPELEVKNLKVAFRQKNGERFTAVNGISYRLNRGETLAVVGESGSGKTVSALSILRLIPEPPGEILAGHIRFGNRDLLRLPAHEMRQVRGREIAMIFQDPMTSLNPVLTVGEQIMETLSAHTSLTRQQIQERTVELLTRVEIPAPTEKIFQYPHQLSGGMRQRVMIAMALACEPRILIADEPTTALDVLVQAQIMDLLRKLKQQTGMSILLITHDLGVVHEVADRMLVMYAGEIVEVGPVSSVFKSPLHPYTLGLKKSVPVLRTDPDSSRRLDEIPGQVPSFKDLPEGCAFHPRCPWAMERCREEKPALQEKTPGHSVRCLLEEPPQ